VKYDVLLSRVQAVIDRHKNHRTRGTLELKLSLLRNDPTREDLRLLYVLTIEIEIEVVSVLILSSKHRTRGIYVRINTSS